MTDSATTLDTVQRKLGRCLLRLQECELLLKSFVAHAEVTAPPAHLQVARNAKVASVQKKTMGTLTDDVLTSARTTATFSMPSNDQQALVRFKYQIELNAEQYEALDSAFKELVSLRNELVHHFLERFDVRSAEGCAAADTHLDECSKIFDGHYLTLLSFTEASKLARAKLASVLETQEFADAVIRGALPD
jgi:hypothetical protein